MVRTVVRGGAKVKHELQRMDVRVDAATLAALKAMQREAKKNIRSRMRGRPRWDHRGASERTGEDVSLNLSPHHVTRSGGPGRLTGQLYRHVGGIRRPRRVGREFHGGVGVGGGVTNLYKHDVEERYPFIAPGVKATEKKAAELWPKFWDRAVHR